MRDGVIYMAFGRPAREAVEKSIETLRSASPDLEVAVVGDQLIDGTIPISWTRASPFDPARSRNFQFRAGIVKPYLAELSPFDRTLYVDGDTSFLQDVRPGFAFLDDWDMAIAKEDKNLCDLYNRPRAAWFHNIRERNATIREFFGNGEVPYWNSGVMFWRRCAAVEAAFQAWAKEWALWKQWDEQQALMRAIFKNPLRLLLLPIAWNSPFSEGDRIIWHRYGRGEARTNVRS